MSRRWSWYRVVAFCAIAFATSVLSESSVRAVTWNKVAQFTGNGYVTSAYFFNRSEGLIGFNGAASGSTIYRTTDGGQTWAPAVTPAAVGVWLSDIWFNDGREGWATCFFGTTPANLWHSTDGGLNWTAMSLVASASGVRKTPNALIVTQYWINGILVSLDQGNSFTTIVTEGHDGLDFVDDLHGVATGFITRFCATSDGGVTWNTISTPQNEAWGVYGFKGTARFLAVPEDASSGLASKVYTSTDYGISWQQQSPMPGKMTGGVQGAGSVGYVQSYLAGGGSGLYRTTDFGVTWSSIGGPSNQLDSRFAVTECGHVIFAFDQSGGVFRSDDVADDLPFVACGFRHDTLSTLSAAICDSLRRLDFIHTPIADTEQLVALYVVDSVRAPYASTSVSLDSIPVLPHQVFPTDSIGFRVAWRPHRFLNRVGKDSVMVRAVFRRKSGLFDTVTMPLHLVANISLARFALSNNTIRVDGVEHCSPRDTAITLLNTGCDTLWLTSALLGPNSDWTLLDANGQPVTLPLGIAAGANVRFILRARPVKEKASSDALNLRFRYFERDSSARVQLATSGKLIDALSTLRSAAFDSLATCATLDSVLWIPNPTCDTIYITAATLNSNDWRLFDTSGAALKLPFAIAPGSSKPILLRFGPANLGGTSGLLTLRFRYLQYDSLHTVALQGAGKQAGTLDHLVSLDFGSVSICSLWDSVLAFQNSTCNAITVDSLQVTGPFELLDAGQLPTSILPGHALRTHIRYSPQFKLSETGEAIIKFFINGKARYDTVRIVGRGVPGASQYTQSPDTNSLRFADRTECDSFDSAVYTITNSGCDSLWIRSITIDDASGVLSIHSSQSPPCVLAGGQNLRLAIDLDSLNPGTYDRTVTIHLQQADGTTRDTTIYVHAAIAPGDRTLALDTNTLRFGSLTLCELHDTIIVYTNRGCMPVSVLNWRMTDFSNGFNVAGNGVAPPIRLMPGESDTLHVTCPQLPGVYIDTVVVGTDADGTKLRFIPVVLNILPADSIAFNIAVDNPTPKAGDVITLRVYPNEAITRKGLKTIDAILEYSGDGLVPVGSPQSSYSVTISNEQRVGKSATRILHISDPNEIALDPASPLVTLKYRVAVSDSSTWYIRFQDVVFNPSVPDYNRCTLGAIGSKATVALHEECGDALIIRDLQGQPLLTLAPLVPNPISNGMSSSIELPVRSSANGIVSVAIFDVNSEKRLESQFAVSKGAEQRLHLDVSGLRSGSYRYTVTLTSPAGSASAVGNLEVIR